MEPHHWTQNEHDLVKPPDQSPIVMSIKVPLWMDSGIIIIIIMIGHMYTAGQGRHRASPY